MPDIIISRYSNNDYIYLAKIIDFHKTIFPDGLISCLGTEFVEEYYKELLTLSKYTVFLAKNDDRLLGFIGYILDQNDLNKLQIFRIVKTIAINKIMFLKLNPVILFRAMIKKFFGRKVNHLPELMMIAVAPDARRLGLGSKLVHKMEEDLINNDITSYCVYTDNPEGLQFYKKLGLETVFSFHFFGKTSACFVKHLD